VLDISSFNDLSSKEIKYFNSFLSDSFNVTYSSLNVLVATFNIVDIGRLIDVLSLTTIVFNKLFLIFNLDSKRDWGHTKDFVKGMWMILQSENPEDYVLSTNESYSIRDFINIAFTLKGFNIQWRGEGINEEGYDLSTGRVLIKVSEKYFRPCEVDQLLGDSSKVIKALNWKREYTFEKLVKEMTENDCK